MLPLAAAVLALSALATWAWGFTIDDAYVIARFAENVSAGEGYGMNPGAPADGVTGPLWLIPALVGASMGKTILAQKITGLVLTLLALALVLRAQDGDRARWLLALLLVAQPTLAVWAVAGLATGAATLAITALAWAVAREKKDARLAWLGAVITGLLFFLRPEAVPAGGCAVVLLAGRPRSAREVGPYVVVIAGAVAVVAFRFVMFDSVLPISVQAKPASVLSGAGYLLRGVLVHTGVLGALLAIWSCVRAAPGARRIGLVLAVYLGSVVLAGGCWMPGFRLLVPALPLYAWLAMLGWFAIRHAAVRVVALVVMLALPILNGVAMAPSVANAEDSREIEGRALAARMSGTVALVDVGFLSYASGVRVVDLGGVTDPEVAAFPGGHLSKEIPESFLIRRDPDMIVLHAAAPPTVEGKQLMTLLGYPVERHVAQLPWVREHYEVQAVLPYAPGYWYVVLGKVR